MSAPDKFIIDIIIDDPRWLNHSSNWESDLTEVITKGLIYLNWSMPCEIAVTLSNDAMIQPLNRDYRAKDSPTNTLSFPSFERGDIPNDTAGEPIPLGDIIIAYETMVKEAHEQAKDLKSHMTHITIHGLLHLLGYDHIIDSEAEIMEALEIKILETFNIGNPYI